VLSMRPWARLPLPPAARRRLVEQVERREVVHTQETFGDYWARWLARRKPDLEAGTWSGYERDQRPQRLLPALSGRSLGDLSVDDIRAFVADQAEAVDAGDLAVKAVTNALVTLVVCLNAAVEDSLIVADPALRVERLPPVHVEREYLRLDEIPRYLDACSTVYRPLAELLISSGVRIGEAPALGRCRRAMEPSRHDRPAPSLAAMGAPRRRTHHTRRLGRHVGNRVAGGVPL
jgi:integrase